MIVARRATAVLIEAANVAELVDALDLGSSGVTRESSSLSFRTRLLNSSDCKKSDCRKYVVEIVQNGAL